MLRALIAIAIALPLYELVRWRILRRLRESQRRKARGYAERHGVRVDLFKFGGKQLVREELLNDQVVLEAMAAAASAGERPTEVRERVEEYIDEIVPAFSLAAYFQLGMRLARAAIHAVYRPLIVRPPPPLPHDATAIFLINHRSNFDYVVVGWALARRVAISYAVGEWARVFPLDALFKAFGGFFVRRGFPDPLYHTVLRRYLQLITRRGVTQGIFPEGGLTRDGALRPPKVGLLDALIQLVEESELYFVPVGINYDRVLEDEALLAELRGRDRPPTRAEKLFSALRLFFIIPWLVAVNAVRLATSRLQQHGYVAVAFGEPIRFRDLAQSRDVARVSPDQRRARAKEIAAMVMRRIARLIPATPVALVARAVLDLGCDADAGDVVERVRGLRAILEEAGIPLALGQEFEPQRQARAALQDDLSRTRELLRFEGELLSSEEAEEIVRLGLERLVQRRALTRTGGRIRRGSHPRADDLLLYYARSLAEPGQPSVRTEAQVSTPP
jgi:glycerol-3-phosphate O-acyltransferase